MLFNSFTFAFFFVIVFVLYWMLKRSYHRQNVILLIASYLFYAWWDIRFLFLIVLSTYVDYCTSLFIDRKRLSPKQIVISSIYLVSASFVCVTCQWASFQWMSPHILDLLPSTVMGWWPTYTSILCAIILMLLYKIPLLLRVKKPEKIYLVYSVVVNLGILGFFKYFNFFTDSFNTLWAWLFHTEPAEITSRVLLPVGISFFTFQTMSHTIDVYRKKIPSTESLLQLATYVAFFPQLVAGPIERGAHLLPQFQRRRFITTEEKQYAYWLILWGLYKKVVIADNVAKIVNGVFGPYDTMQFESLSNDGINCLLAVYAFAFQIYCDFSGYTDIARGTAKLLGFDIMLNFNLPYIAVNPTDFWKRWHISLSSWLRDYLYIPLGGNRKGNARTIVNLFLTMLLGGLWHGAHWTFVLWGGYHGGLLIIYRLFGDTNTQGYSPMKRIIKAVVMFHLVCLGWLIFRAQNLTTIGLFLKSMIFNPVVSESTGEMVRQLFSYIWFLVLFQGLQIWKKELYPIKQVHWFLRLNMVIFLVVSLMRLAPHGAQEFIYFAF